MDLRPYQKNAIDFIRQECSKGTKNILIWMATGAGKTVVFGDLISKISAKNKKTIFIVKGKDLVEQAAQEIRSYGIKTAVVMADNSFDKSSDVFVCSSDTLHRRLKNPEYAFLFDTDFLIVDECHLATSDSYNYIFDSIEYRYCIGFTASPFTIAGRNHTRWQTCYQPITGNELNDMGFLVCPKYIGAKPLDTSQVKKHGGDFSNSDLYDLVNDRKIVGDIVESYKKFSGNKAAVLFAVNIAHSKQMANAFNDAGIKAMHLDGNDSLEKRMFYVEQIKSGNLKVLCNVDIFSVGSNIPQLEVCINARPTLSRCVYVQQVGRVLRPYKICSCGKTFGAEQVCHELNYEKKHAVVIDHACNFLRFGHVFDETPPDIYEKKHGKTKNNEHPMKYCEKCFSAYESLRSKCPFCDAENQVDQKELNKLIKENPYELAQLGYEDLLYQKLVKAKKNMNYQYWKVKKVGYAPKDSYRIKQYTRLISKFKDFALKYSDYLGIHSRELEEIAKSGIIRRASGSTQKYYYVHSEKVSGNASVSATRGKIFFADSLEPSNEPS